MSSPSSDRDIPESKASSSRKKSRDKRTLCACQRCRSLKKKCKPQEGRTSARCTRCEATGEVCRYYSVSNDPRLQNGSSNDQDTSSPSSWSQKLAPKPLIVIPPSPEPADVFQSPPNELPPRTPSSGGSPSFVNPLGRDLHTDISPTSNHSSLHTNFSSGSASSLASIGTPATHIHSHNDPAIFKSSGSHNTSPTSSFPTAHAPMDQQPSHAFQSYTLQDEGQRGGISSDLPYPGHLSPLTSLGANWYLSPSRHHQHQETRLLPDDYILDRSLMHLPGTFTQMHILPSDQENFAGEEAPRCWFCAEGIYPYHSCPSPLYSGSSGESAHEGD